MVFLGIYRAVYDYAPSGDNELNIRDGDLLFVLEKGDDGWWKAKKKAQDDSEEEPEGLIPENYIDEAAPIHKAKALYDYTRQTDEELSFAEDATLEVYDTTDPDWTLVGANGEYGFAPSNYIEVTEAAPAARAPPAAPAQPPRPRLAEPEPEPEEPPTPPSADSLTQSPAAALAGMLQQKTGSAGAGVNRAAMSPPLPTRQVQFTPEESDDEQPAPSLPTRPASGQFSPPPQQTQYASAQSPEPPGILNSPPHNRVLHKDYDDEKPALSPGGFHLYNIHEMVSAIGKNKKMPVTLGINIGKGIIMISPEKSRDAKEWTAQKLTHYSIEGKHVFMELVKPSKSIDFHAGAKDTAQEIVAALGELAGAAKAEGLREVLAASTGSQKKGEMIYDFMAQGEDEVSVAIGDEVVVLDDSKSDEWWMVRRLKNGNEGVVPSSYVKITGTLSAVASPALDTGRSFVEQNRREEERMARQASKASKSRDRNSSVEVGPGFSLPTRNSSLMPNENDARRSSTRSKRDNRDSRGSKDTKTKPNVSNTRVWVDRTGSFRVEAEFIGLREGKIHLHKLNGVKIAVPVTKMSIKDLEYVENRTGISLDDDKPLSDIKRRNTNKAKEQQPSSSSSRSKAGITIGQPKPDEYDWFDFFLQCGINPQICERYASSFNRDNMTQESMPDISPELLRTLGLKEGDILKVMKFLDAKYSRGTAKEKKGVSFADNGEEGANGTSGGLFSGAGGALRNNTRKGRPAPAVQTNDVVDPTFFEEKAEKQSSVEARKTPLVTAPPPEKKSASGFDDNAWEPRETKTPQPSAASGPAISPPAQASAPTSAPPQQPALTGSVLELSGLAPPLQPTPVPQTALRQQAPAPAPAPQQQAQPTGATPSLFDQLARQPPATQPQQSQQQSQSFVPHQNGYGQLQQQMAAARQRPQAPQPMQSTSGLVAPPPTRAASAPQNFQQQSAFGPPPPIQPQLTGYQPNMQSQVAQPGQSMQELNQQRMQQQQQQNFGQSPLQAQQTGFGQQNPGFGQFQNGMVPQQTGFGQFPQQQQLQMPQQTGFNQFQPQQLQPQQTGYQQSFANGQQNGSPFADPPRAPFQPMPIGMQNTFSPALQPQATGINAFLPPALQPQQTGMNMNRFGSPQSAFGGRPPSPVPPIPQQQTMQPLQPQKTGPPPPVRFGVSNAPKLVPQPTGRRANLSQATPQNPFGF